MDVKLDEELFRKYKFTHTKGLQNDCMAFGFECGNGWYIRLDNLFGKIDKYFEQHPCEAQSSWTHEGRTTVDYWRITQVKEKFSTLRVYTNWYIDEIDKWIEEAERLSEYTCEQCGKKQKKKTAYKSLCKRGWLFNMCTKCWNKHKKENITK